MSKILEFVKLIKTEFPDDRLTYQKSIPTFHPETSEETASLFKLANKHSQPVYITGFGNNISPVGKPFKDLLSIKTDRLNNVIEINPDDFFITVGAGYPLREINKQLIQHNLWLPHSDLPYVGSVGGAVAVGLNSDYEQHDLPLKKYLIKAEIITPTGEIIAPGSVCFKSVSGYDVVKIFSGSWGLLGMIFSATFRVMPVSGKDDYGSIKLKKIDRDNLISTLDENNRETDAVYSQKLKAKFDINNILPIVSLV